MKNTANIITSLRMANNTDSCYPSMNKISEMCCVSKSTVIETVNKTTLIKSKVDRKSYKANESITVGKFDEEQEAETTTCTIEEAEDAIRIARAYHANNHVNYVIGVICKQKNYKEKPVKRYNSFSDFPQMEYIRDDFDRIEKMLLE